MAADVNLTRKNKPILIIDSACDQSLMSVLSCRILSKLGIFYQIHGAMQGMRSRNRVELCNVCSLASCSDGSKFILVINQALVDYDSNQFESLLQPHQVHDNGIVIDDIAKRHCTNYDGNYGTQSIHLSDDSRIPLDYDGFKVYLQISKPTDDDMVRYPHVVLTSDSTYTPQTRKCS